MKMHSKIHSLTIKTTHSYAALLELFKTMG
jgi:hypothetical protein